LLRTAYQLTEITDEKLSMPKKPAPTPEETLDQLGTDSQGYGLIGSSRALREVRRKIRMYANSDKPLLIIGETGVGKELVATALHENSSRREKPFVKANSYDYLGDHDLARNDLFGHETGAYTGANEKREGLISTARDGTLLLDEFGSLPNDVQGKFLRVLENKEYYRFGGDALLTSRCRIVATTNRMIDQIATSGERAAVCDTGQYGLRDDIVERFPLKIYIPPLRSRRRDTIDLFLHFCDQELRPEAGEFELGVIHFILQHDWPRNVRELKNRVGQYAELKRSGQKHGGYDILFGWLPQNYFRDFFSSQWFGAGLKWHPIWWAGNAEIRRSVLLEFAKEHRSDDFTHYLAPELDPVPRFLIEQVRTNEIMTDDLARTATGRDRRILDGFVRGVDVRDQLNFFIRHVRAPWAIDLCKQVYNSPKSEASDRPAKDGREVRGKILLDTNATMKQMKKQIIEYVYKQNGRNFVRAAKSLDMDRQTVSDYFKSQP
jgi:DNA-binding NtrC family response regulator